MTTWADLKVLMGGTRVATATGVFRTVIPPDEEQTEVEVVVQRFTCEMPNRWRVEGEDGTLIRLNDGARVLLRRSTGVMEQFDARTTSYGFSPDPLNLIRPQEPWDWSPGDDYATPTGAPVEEALLGRRCWRVDLEPPAHKQGFYTLWIDAATGIRLRRENAEAGWVEELLELAIDVDLPADAFAWDGPVDTSEQDERDRDEQARQHFQDYPPSVPTTWPRGLGHHVVEGHPDTGEYLAMLEVPGGALLSRRPLGRPAWTGHDEAVIQRWADERWQWALVAHSGRLTDAELAAVMAGLTADDGTGA